MQPFLCFHDGKAFWWRITGMHMSLAADEPLQKYSIGLPWNINGPVPMELHGGSMVSAIKNPWECHGLFMVNSMDLPWIFDNRPWFCYIYYKKSMEQPWVFHVIPMDNRWDFLWVF